MNDLLVLISFIFIVACIVYIYIDDKIDGDD